MDYEIDFNLEQYDGFYPKKEIAKAKRQLYDDFHKSTARTLLEIIVKKKCGILTNDVVDYKLYDKKPCEDFNESLEFINPKFDETKEEKTVEITQNENDKIIEIETGEIEFISEFDKVATISQKHEEVYSNNSITQIHACEEKFCPRNIKINSSNKIPLRNIIYVCDFCQHTVCLEENMKKHLKEYDHYSSTEYLYEKNESPVKSNFFMNDYLPKIYSLKSRASIKNLNTNGTFRVFCPQCSMCFDIDTLACAVHYNFAHSGKNDFIYSISELKREETINIDKKHQCSTCQKPFKKLTDLVAHLDITKHFPHTKKDEINLFECPFDNCYFSAIYYFSFKQHLLSHPFFNRPKEESPFLNVDVKFKVYSVPTSFYHIPAFCEEIAEDKHEEIKSIDCLLSCLKGHNDHSEINKKLKARKDYLHKKLKGTKYENLDDASTF